MRPASTRAPTRGEPRHVRSILSVLVLILFIVVGPFVALYAANFRFNGDVRTWGKYAVEAMASRRGDPQALAALVEELKQKKISLSLYAPDGTLLASSVHPPLSLTSNEGQSVHPVVERGAVVARGVAQVVRVSAQRPWAFWSGIGALFLGLTWLFVIGIGSPLQKLAEAARRFGGGEMNARARIGRNNELGRVGRSFDEMADRVATLIAAQRELMANVSHELQTPIARIQVAIDLMMDGIDDRVTEQLPFISQDLRELERLIDDVMTLSRFELASVGEKSVTPLRREPTILEDLIGNSAARFRSLHPSRALEVHVAAEIPALSLDATMVRRVIDNLIDNANKYSSDGAPIDVTARVRGGQVHIAVQDHGMGIDAEDLQRLFTPFFRTDRSRARSTGGIGLGLVLARRVVEAHGGTIEIESQLGVGTTVKFSLPVAPGLA